MQALFRLTPVAVVACLALTSSAFADDWVAKKLRGGVFAFFEGEWHQLHKGSVVPDERVIRTMQDGRVQFVRDKETIDLDPNSQIRIYDKAESSFTVVQQHYGQVAIEAEKRDVQHFAVQTEVLAAVVKGTRFSVRSGGGTADVSVDRGQVEVRDTVHNLTVRVNPGQEASAGETQALDIAGAGEVDDIVPFKGGDRSPEIVADRSAKGKAKAAKIIEEVVRAHPEDNHRHAGEGREEKREHGHAKPGAEKTGVMDWRKINRPEHGKPGDRKADKPSGFGGGNFGEHGPAKHDERGPGKSGGGHEDHGPGKSGGHEDHGKSGGGHDEHGGGHEDHGPGKSDDHGDKGKKGKDH